MTEKEMVQAVQVGVTKLGADDEIRAAGLFEPRGHSGSMFAGGMIGGDLGEDIPGVSGVATVGGALAAQHLHDTATGLPETMIVGASDSRIYGFEKKRGHHDAGRPVFQVDRAGLEVKVHQRINVRVLELIHPDSGSKVELEGLRFPGQHAGDVINVLES